MQEVCLGICKLKKTSRKVKKQGDFPYTIQMDD